MQLCPQCGHLNAERAKFCSECGAKLAAVVSIDPPSETPPVEPEPVDRLDAPVSAGRTQSEFGEPDLLDRIDLELEEEAPAPSTLNENPSAKLPPTPVVPVPHMPARQPEPAAPTPLPPPAPEAPGRTTPKLHVIRGERIDIEYPIYPGKNYIGRTDEKPVDIDLEDQERSDKIWSSRQHAIIHFENGVLMIEDLNSLNGTFVNRVRLLPGQTRTLRGNDVVQIGTVQMKVVFS
jgi:hypothetical protein